MFCPKCGNKNADNSRYCEVCGCGLFDVNYSENRSSESGSFTQNMYYGTPAEDFVRGKQVRSKGRFTFVILIILIIVAVAAAFFGMRFWNSQKWQKDYTNGLEYYEKQDYEMAADFFSDVINDDDQHTEAYIARGDSYKKCAEQYMEKFYSGLSIEDVAQTASSSDINIIYGYYQKAYDDYSASIRKGDLRAEDRKNKIEKNMESLLKKNVQVPKQEVSQDVVNNDIQQNTEGKSYSSCIFSNSSSSYLSESDLRGLSSWSLSIARNEIYARNGRMFKDNKLQSYFNSQSWYTPTVKPENFKDSMLNKYEKANVKLISDYEKKLSGGAQSSTPAAVPDNSSASGFIFSSSSSSYLKQSDIEGMDAWTLSIARNEIYARKGRMFKDQKLQSYFNSKSWYSGTIRPENFDNSMLNSYEQSNVKLISDYEKKMGYS